MRNQVFYSLNELNARIRELLDVVNQAPLRGYGVSRRELFERLDGPALKALPATRFVYGEWSACKLRMDYHVEADGHFYSAPHALAGETLHIRISAGTIEIWLRRRRITSHQRSHKKGEYTTNREHMPASHRAHVELTPATLVAGACKTGPQTATKENATLNEETEDKVDEALGHAWGMERPTLDPSGERFGLIVDAEQRSPDNRRLKRSLTQAKLKVSQACLEGVDYAANRKLDKAVVAQSGRSTR